MRVLPWKVDLVWSLLLTTCRQVYASSPADYSPNMQLFSLFALFVFAFVVAAQDAANEQPTELVIETTYNPEDCTVTAAKGDRIRVHYVSRPCTAFAFLLVFYLSLSHRPVPCSPTATSSIPGT